MPIKHYISLLLFKYQVLVDIFFVYKLASIVLRKPSKTRYYLQVYFKTRNNTYSKLKTTLTYVLSRSSYVFKVFTLIYKEWITNLMNNKTELYFNKKRKCFFGSLWRLKNLLLLLLLFLPIASKRRSLWRKIKSSRKGAVHKR